VRTNPFLDTWHFLTQPAWTTALFWILLLASISIAVFNWRRDRRQHAIHHLWNWAFRLIIGAMWWQQSLWKLPPTYTDQPDGSGGLRYWVGEMAHYAAFGVQRHFVEKTVLPHFYFFAPQVYSAEVLIALSLMLGIFSRIGGLLGALMAANLWLGLYRAPSEWPWTYFFLMSIQITFLLYGPGFSLGLDALRSGRRSQLPEKTKQSPAVRSAA
jgi:uncharacterized membrane protein YphA (DoxX/SURF4 family)